MKNQHFDTHSLNFVAKLDIFFDMPYHLINISAFVAFLLTFIMKDSRKVSVSMCRLSVAVRTSFPYFYVSAFLYDF